MEAKTVEEILGELEHITQYSNKQAEIISALQEENERLRKQNDEYKRAVASIYRKDVDLQEFVEATSVYMSEATRKYDGSACAIINGQLYKRYDVKKGKSVPPFAIPCQEPDAITGHWPHWVLCQHDKPEDKYFIEAFETLPVKIDGTYECCGPKVQGNPESFAQHTLVRHGDDYIQMPIEKITFEDIRAYLTVRDIEGIVFHAPDGRMCKIRKSDFGIKR